MQNRTKALAIAILTWTISGLVTSSSACEYFRESEQVRWTVTDYYRVAVNQRCVLVYSMKTSAGRLSFKNVERGNLDAPAELNVSLDSSDPELFKLTIIAKQAGEYTFSFIENATLPDNQVLGFMRVFKIEATSSSQPANNITEKPGRTKDTIVSRSLSKDSRIDGVRVTTICEGALTADKHAFDTSPQASFYLKKAKSAKLTLKECRNILDAAK